eukprot:TRINITY_DN2147_c0_g3_i1.p1 TRINITY_DN2147_c0_g3~~TRINITY_DN2147_c0_g3_i1.p1  ORF type:complete len:211 (-),score=52.31 TRINITY_DN2147_c0_g3_i1:101-733(-)
MKPTRVAASFFCAILSLAMVRCTQEDTVCFTKDGRIITDKDHQQNPFTTNDNDKVSAEKKNFLILSLGGTVISPSLSPPIFVETNTANLTLLLDTATFPIDSIIKGQDIRVGGSVEHVEISDANSAAVILVACTTGALSIWALKIFVALYQIYRINAHPRTFVWPVYCVHCSNKCSQGLYCYACGAQLCFPPQDEKQTLSSSSSARLMDH